MPTNNFESKGGTQNIAQGDGAIGSQTNNIHHHYSRTAQGIPLQRPPLAEHFKGRDAVLNDLLPLLQPGKVVAICGPGGMGKTALAAQAAWTLAPGKEAPALFPDGIIFHSFYGQEDVSLAFAHIVRSYDEAQQDVSFAAAFRLMASKQALLILDGAEEASNLPAVLKLRGGCGVLITSRKKEDAPDELLELKKLEKQPAEEVFRHCSKIAGDDANVAGICKLLDGWPVALRIAGRYLRRTKESAADYLKWLEQEPFKELGDGEHQQENAALLLRRSVDAVSGDARLALGLAGTLAFASIAREPVAAILDADERRARTALNELVNYGLLEKREERWQISHALVHTYARTELALSKESLERLAGYYISFCEAASAENAKGFIRLDTERAHYLRLMESCLASKLWQEVSRLAGATFTYLFCKGWWTGLLAALEMNLTAARQAGDRKHEGECLGKLGSTYFLMCGEVEKALACCEQCLSIHRELQDRKGERAPLNTIALIYRGQGKFEHALPYLEQSLCIAREVGDREWEGRTLNSIGHLYGAHGKHEQALPYYEQCLPIWREIGDKIEEDHTLGDIAATYRAQGNYAKIIERSEQDLAICQELGDRAGEAQSCWNIGLTYKDLGDLAKAEEHISLAVQIAEKIGHPSLEEWREGLARVRTARRG